MKTSDNLAAARYVLIERGWAPKRMRQDDGRVCALGALFEIDVDPFNSFETECLAQAVRDIWGSNVPQDWAPSCTVVGFNDHVAYSESQIVSIYDRAVIIAKEAEVSEPPPPNPPGSEVARPSVLAEAWTGDAS